ncbi:unnamed protein product [Staurois parvus]|uniref:Uncharacterized protein n=1 Tax=Staurois parvus TaxID=386267 RepID=A0ABN9FAZ8_9NEOB|nr:unnamed protein product [Staurois parvus]
MQSVAMETAAMGRAVQGPMTDVWTWQQHEEAVYRGLWQIRGLGSSYRRPIICQHPMSKNSTHTSSVRRPEIGTWQSVAMETAAMGGRTVDLMTDSRTWQAA